MSDYKHIFFDLDHTLWDFATNSRLALCKLFGKYELGSLLNTVEEEFLEVYYRVNDEKWDLYRKGILNKEALRRERVRDTLLQFGHEDENLCLQFDDEYLSLSPHQTALLPGTITVLDYLRAKYHLHIITNGFSEVQNIKLIKSGLKPYFRHIITSEMVGANKPSATIFIESLKKAGAKRKNSLMIGDNLVADIIGARNCGIDQVYFNPVGTSHSEKVTHEIKGLKELMAFL